MPRPTERPEDAAAEPDPAPLISFIREFTRERSAPGLVLGLSGGLDSAVLCSLAARALGGGHVHALMLPDRTTPAESLRHARACADACGVDPVLQPIDPVLLAFKDWRRSWMRRLPRFLAAPLLRAGYRHYTKKAGHSPYEAGMNPSTPGPYRRMRLSAEAYYRLKHRVRAVMLYEYAERRGLPVAGAANRTEWMTGFFVRYGCDHLADVMPLLHLYKTGVRQLARRLPVPREVIDMAPSPDLMPGITDEYALGITYSRLDAVLELLDRRESPADISRRTGIPGEEVERVIKLRERAEAMRSTAATVHNSRKGAQRDTEE
ncbi:NAD(+) synthase [Kiritimatiella glycovorans]|uniref:NH(3)-dependent NAD(+) synthetase n=1 Tax=Kiritimatiella glycovorans TaxID=1307763 RepID=A0A0G3EBB8_9BACT|nr:NAD(+) synthase [Kiritimatiella glycovorans]AKJ63786.1 NH(3)-dependent NAD(+) synthetase [Kiritimatiella glycovorans]